MIIFDSERRAAYDCILPTINKRKEVNHEKSYFFVLRLPF
jgi:hypothetical protein